MDSIVKGGKSTIRFKNKQVYTSRDLLCLKKKKESRDLL